jgi:hypothetical protein
MTPTSSAGTVFVPRAEARNPRSCGGGHRAGREVATMPKKDKEGKKDIKKGKEVDKG